MRRRRPAPLSDGPLALDHSEDDEFDGEPGDTAVAEEPSLFRTAVSHRDWARQPGEPGDESHDRESDEDLKTGAGMARGSSTDRDLI
jgi:hypothetical protein